ncbi:malonyl-ACP O-methyltransferase BioC [Agarivorans sp. MS3-6]
MIIDKRLVAQFFSKAVTTYNDFAGLQRDIGHRLLTFLPSQRFPLAIDLGCGTGYFSAELQARADYLISVDLSHAMARQTMQTHHGLSSVVSDAEHLGLANHSVDLVFSNLALQWCNDLPQALAEIKRILKPNGVAIFSTLVDGSLCELKQAWAEIDQHSHVNSFLHQSDIEKAIENSGFNQRDITIEDQTLWYEHAFMLLAELKGIGANYVVEGQHGLANPTQLKKMAGVYKQKFAKSEMDNRMSASYKVCYGVLIND